MAAKKQATNPDSLFVEALERIDNQIARAMQRSPAEREAHGVQKWEPILERIERLSSNCITAFGEGTIQLDSLLVAAQAFAKILSLIAQEFGEDALGKLRASYCLDAFERIEVDARRGIEALSGDAAGMN